MQGFDVHVMSEKRYQNEAPDPSKQCFYFLLLSLFFDLFFNYIYHRTHIVVLMCLITTTRTVRPKYGGVKMNPGACNIQQFHVCSMSKMRWSQISNAGTVIMKFVQLSEMVTQEILCLLEDGADPPGKRLVDLQICDSEWLFS